MCEVSVYVEVATTGQGLGTRLLGALLAASQTHGIWTSQASIFPKNRANVTLKEFGSRVFGRRERVTKVTGGPFTGKWRDTLHMERRIPLEGLA